MADRTPDKVEVSTYSTAFVWTSLTDSVTDGTAVNMAGNRDKSVHVFGTFGSGTITMQGSNEAAPTAGGWVTLKDVNGDDLTFTTKGIEAIGPSVRNIRPVLSGSTGADLTVILLTGGS